MTERTTVRLPEDLLKRAKRKAAAEGRTLTSLITDGLQHVVSEPSRAAKHRRVLPRVSKAKGGLMPGVDLSSFSRLQENDDLDRIDRMNRPK
jgi:CopG-like RHH_1 or ribbon-helix-helix domain, RHH_5